MARSSPKIGILTTNSLLHRTLTGLFLTKAAETHLNIDCIFVSWHLPRLLLGAIKSGYVRRLVKRRLLLRAFGRGRVDSIPLQLSELEGRFGKNQTSKWANSYDKYVKEHKRDIIHLLGMPSMNIPTIRERKCDVLCHICGEFGLIRKPLMETASTGIIITHGGAYLPKYRGMSVAEWGLFKGEPLAVNTFLVDEGVDTGPILLQEEFEVESINTLGQLYADIQYRNMALLVKTLIGMKEGKVHLNPQKKQEGEQYYYMHPALIKLVLDNFKQDLH